MTSGVPGPRSGASGFAAYQRETIVQFFADASVERARLLSEMATARRRIADANAALAQIDEMEHACIGAVLDAQRALRDERHANARAIASVQAHAEAEAEQILHEARLAVTSETGLPETSFERRVPSNGSTARQTVDAARFARPWIPDHRA